MTMDWWLGGVLALAMAALLVRRLLARRPPEPLGAAQGMVVNAASTGTTDRDQVSEMPITRRADRLARQVAWLEGRELSRIQQRTRLLDELHLAVSGIERCAETAGANQRVQALLDEAQDRLRRIARDLKAEVSPLGGAPTTAGDLHEGLQALIAHVRNASPLPVETRIDSAVRGLLPVPLSDHVLFVVRESLANAIQHAGASRLALRAAVESRRLVISVSDDGRGFVPGSPLSQRQQGLKKMQARADAVKGLLQIESAQGVGTIVTLTVPIQREAPGILL